MARRASPSNSAHQLGDRVLDVVEADNTFCEMALIDNAPRSATATTDVTLAAISEKQFLFRVSETPHFALMVMRVPAHRLRASNNAL
jgi:CRP-like cAMP-binding protein